MNSNNAMSQGKKLAAWRSIAFALAWGFACQTQAQEAGASGGISEPILDGVDLDMVQDAWQGKKVKKRTGQVRPGATVYHYCENCVYRVRSRTSTTTTLRVDPSEVITSIVNGNGSWVEAKKLQLMNHIVEIRPIKIGVDTSIKLNTASGRTYIYWVSTEDENAQNTSDLIVDVLLEETNERRSKRSTSRTSAATSIASARGGALSVMEQLTSEGQEIEARDRARLATIRSPVTNRALLEKEYGNLKIDEFDPSKMVFDLTVFASSEEAARALAPTRVFRDDKWTWFDYSHLRNEGLLPAVSLVTEGTETPVDWGILGEDGRFLVVKAIGDLALRSGQHIVCVRIARPETRIATATTVNAKGKTIPLLEIHAGTMAPVDPSGKRPSTAPIKRTGAQPASAKLHKSSLLIEADEGQKQKAAKIIARELGNVTESSAGRFNDIETRHARRTCRALAQAGIMCEVRKQN